MNSYKIEGKNAEGQKGSWIIEADSREEFLKIVETRGLSIDKVDGKELQRVKPTTREVEHGV